MAWAMQTGAVLAATLLLSSVPCHANSTLCTDAATRKPGLRAALWLELPEGGAPALEAAVSKFASSKLAMSVGGVGMEDPYKKPILRTSNLILQSPDVSVGIEIKSSNRTDRAYVIIERQCYQNAIVPWKPYWVALTGFFRRQGYRMVSPPQIDLRKAGFWERRRLVPGP